MTSAVPPFRRRTLFFQDNVRLDEQATVGDDADSAGQLDRSGADFMAEGHVLVGGGIPFFAGTQHAARFAGQANSGLAADAELVEVFGQLLGPHGQRDLGDADVAGLDQDTSDVQHSVVMDVVDGPASRARERAILAEDGRFGSKFATFEAHRDRDHFHDRTGFAWSLNGDVGAQAEIGLRFRFFCAIEPGGVGHSKHFAGLGIHDNNRTTPSSTGSHGLHEFQFGGVLNEAVQGEGDIDALLPWVDDPTVVSVLAAIAEDAHFAGATLQFGVEAGLQSDVAHALFVEAADDVNGKGVVGVDTPVVAKNLDVAERTATQGFEAGALVGGEVALENELVETGFRGSVCLDGLAVLLGFDLALFPHLQVANLGGKFGRFEPKDRGYIACEEVGVGDSLGVYGSGLSTKANGECLSSAVENLAAVRWNRDNVLLLRSSGALEFFMLEDLEVDEAQDYQNGPTEDDPADDDRAFRCPAGFRPRHGCVSPQLSESEPAKRRTSPSSPSSIEVLPEHPWKEAHRSQPELWAPGIRTRPNCPSSGG